MKQRGMSQALRESIHAEAMIAIERLACVIAEVYGTRLVSPETIQRATNDVRERIARIEDLVKP